MISEFPSLQEVSAAEDNDEECGVSRLDFRISSADLRAHGKALNWAFIDSCLFVLPQNDGESLRACQILSCIRAPNVHKSKQSWGAILDRELERISWSKYHGLKSVLIFEMPGKDYSQGASVCEQMLEKRGLNVVIVDHHQYQWVDRTNRLSSLEQLCQLISWPLNFTDMAIAVNDRSFIAGLKQLKLSRKEIMEVRQYDLLAQGYTRASIKQQHSLLPAYIESLREKKRGDLWILEDSSIQRSFILQELALNTADGIVHLIERRGNKLGFSGSPKVVSYLNQIDFCRFGFCRGYTVYSGGDSRFTKFWGFRPKSTREELSPQTFSKLVGEIVNCLEID